MKKINCGIIIDNGKLDNWQYQSLINALDYIDIKLVINITNTHYPKKKFLKYFFFYLIRLTTYNLSFTKKINLTKYSNITFKTKIIKKNNYNYFNDQTIKLIKNHNINLLVKFGGGLLNISNLNFLKNGILSYHHGDPKKYRGRPMGFYEIINNEDKVGIIVQQIDNHIDKGKILSLNYSKIYNYSYSKTIKNLYSNSNHLLKKAIINLSINEEIKIEYSKKLYRYPSNILSIFFIFLILKNLIIKILNSIFYYNSWEIFYIENFKELKLFDYLQNFNLIKFKTINKSKNELFISDPFVLNDSILYESFSIKTKKGSIKNYNITENRIDPILSLKNHISYPYIIKYDRQSFLLPEMSKNLSQKIFQLNNNKITNEYSLLGFENYKIIDPSYFFFKGKHYIFCGFENNSLDNLYLFHSDNIFGKYKPHQLNPIVVDPTCSRMAGNILINNNNLYRFSQNNSHNYGSSINIMKIVELSEKKYKEVFFNKIEFKDKFGPHTISFDKNIFATDGYLRKFSLFSLWYKIKFFK